MLTLLKINLLSYFGINKAIHTKDKKQKRKLIWFSILMIVVILYLFFISFMYSTLAASGLEPLGLMNMLLASMMSAASFITLLTTIYKVDGMIFGFKDYDMIMSLPVKTGVIVASRILMLYVFNTFMVFLLMIPAGIVYALKMSPPFMFYPFFLVTLFLIPIVPIILGTAVGVVIAYISSKFRKKNLFNILISFVFILGIMFGAQALGSVDESAIADIGTGMMESAQRIYPLTKVYVDAVHGLNFVAFLEFLLINLVAFGGFSFIIGKFFAELNTSFATTKTRKNYKLGEMRSNSALKALFQREWRRYTSSPIYVLNTSLGAIMLVVMSLGFLIFGSAQLEQMLAIPGFSSGIAMFAPIVLSGLATFTSTTYPSVSLEGKSLWVVKSCPVSVNFIFMGKMLLNMMIFVPTVLISAAVLIYILRPSLIHCIFILVTPLCYIAFSSVLGVVVNLHFPNFEWSSPVTPVKQSLSLILCMLATLITVGVPIALFFMLKMTDTIVLMAGTTVVIALLTAALYYYMNTKGKAIWDEF